MAGERPESISVDEAAEDFLDAREELTSLIEQRAAFISFLDRLERASFVKFDNVEVDIDDELTTAVHAQFARKIAAAREKQDKALDALTTAAEAVKRQKAGVMMGSV